MRRFKIINIDNYDYTLIDDKLNKREITIEFHKLNELPRVNSYIYLSDNLLNEHLISLGPLGSKYGKKLDKDDEDDISVLEIDGEKIYLQRYYG